MSEGRAPYLAIQDDCPEPSLLPLLQEDATQVALLRALQVIAKEYSGYGRLIVEFRNGKVFLVGQESVQKVG